MEYQGCQCGLARLQLLKRVIPTEGNKFQEVALPPELEQKLNGVHPICAVHLGAQIPLIGLNVLQVWGEHGLQ
jgi:hypothetical protein